MQCVQCKQCRHCTRCVCDAGGGNTRSFRAIVRAIEEAMQDEDDDSTIQLAIRFPLSTIRRLDAIAERSSAIPGVTASRSDLLRAAVLRGLEVLDREVGSLTTNARTRRRRSK
jgi:hypothetical protein